MAWTTSTTSLSRTRSPRSPSPPPALLTQKRTLLSRLRRYPATATPSAVQLHEGKSSDSSTPMSDPKWDKSPTPVSGGKWDKRASRRAPPPPPPPSNLLRESSLEGDVDVEVMGVKEETEWERIRTLPRVRLVPPEGI
ncbi:hypothetical protein BCR39DRAFT_529736 [Naematelia encephala]|uniref:Uncharacterized protein n=1 Tax=Naematelia encephala TaxID=71784 RepID=A0A1Y2B6C3_9TREE|nr:hypothetical protein BCR39DRAFT_529736 [Naematelia encephala]